jgi:hypothetical protein
MAPRPVFPPSPIAANGFMPCPALPNASERVRIQFWTISETSPEVVGLLRPSAIAK